MGHIFISYSHKDRSYIERLASALREHGFDIWVDNRLDYGSQWPNEIQKYLDTCTAFIVVMSANSFGSEWVQSELSRAKRKKKPIYPLLLEDEPWLSVESTQFIDVRGGNLPDEKFYNTLEAVASRLKKEETFHPAPAATVAPIPAKSNRGMQIGIGVLCVGLILLMAWLLPKWGKPEVPTEAPATKVGEITSVPTTVVSTQPVSTTSVPPSDTPSPAPTAIENVDMALVSEGIFTMGNDQKDVMERPAHAVYLNAYSIDKYEVTNKAYRTCVDAGKCTWPTDIGSATRSNYYGNPDFDDYPVVNVSWDMAQAYCSWREARLPTEAEWEKAARGVDQRTYPWGEASADCSKANYNACGGDTSAVGKSTAGQSPYGIFDMAGNVWEWVADWYQENYYSTLGTNPSNPSGPAAGTERVIRGGSWFNSAKSLRTTLRNFSDPSKIYNYVGFRCAKDSAP
jgi:formylglycine-generating enzyme required for sulfatase activity